MICLNQSYFGKIFVDLRYFSSLHIFFGIKITKTKLLVHFDAFDYVVFKIGWQITGFG